MTATGRVGAVRVASDLGGASVRRLMARVEERMAVLAHSHGAALSRHAGETIAAGGKRLRPLLVLLAAGVPPPEHDELIGAAVAVELVHGATLVHDDVLDRSALRRGRPTVVAVGGRRVATATGDLLFSRAFAELSAGGSMEAVRILSATTLELARGEVMQRGDAFAVELSVERYLEQCRLKTAVLFRAACELGTLFAPAPGLELGAFGERIGLAFQILDDVLDISGPPEQTGKPRGADLLDGTVTLPLILARELDPGVRATDLRTLSSKRDAVALCERIASTGALDGAKSRALELVERAKQELPELPAPQRDALSLLADGVVERYS